MGRAIGFSALLLLMLILCASVHAENSESGPLGFGRAKHDAALETDRPDFTEGTQTVTAGHLQIEAGYGFTYNDEDGANTKEHVVPQLLLRIGLIEELELRIAWDGYVRTEEEFSADGISGDNDDNGTSDLSLGIKNEMYEASGWLPALSYIAELSLPVGSEELTSDEVEPAYKLLWAYELDEQYSAAGNINFAAPVEVDERFFETSASLTLAVSLSERLGTYVEYFGFYPDGGAPDTTSTHFLNGGFTYGLNENLQIDVLAGFGLNDEADDFFTGVGVAVRI